MYYTLFIWSWEEIQSFLNLRTLVACQQLSNQPPIGWLESRPWVCFVQKVPSSRPSPYKNFLKLPLDLQYNKRSGLKLVKLKSHLFLQSLLLATLVGLVHAALQPHTPSPKRATKQINNEGIYTFIHSRVWCNTLITIALLQGRVLKTGNDVKKVWFVYQTPSALQ